MKLNQPRIISLWVLLSILCGVITAFAVGSHSNSIIAGILVFPLGYAIGFFIVVVPLIQLITGKWIDEL